MEHTREFRISKQIKIVFKLCIFLKMPYVKDGIGIPPRYVFSTAFRRYSHDKCTYISACMEYLNIPHVKDKYRDECALTFGDSYNAYVEDLESRFDDKSAFVFTHPFAAYLFG